MKRVVCVLTLCLAATAFAADKKPAAAPADKKAGGGDEMAKMMAEMEKAATPGVEHKALVEMAGNWTSAGKMYMDPTKPPTESKGTEECKAILGGRFLECTYKGQMMGKPFEGIGVSGYDNMKKKYVMTWKDNMGTMILYTEGTGDAKSRTYTGEETMPNGQKRPFRWVIKIDSKDKHSMEMYAPGMDGKEAKQMEIVYTRAK
jgi:hypothetical protein